MARRKDHPPEQLREMILSAAQNIIKSKGLKSLTTRNLANEVGYVPGTIYNFYRDMDALISEVNYVTLGRLEQACRDSIKDKQSNLSKIRVLAYAYVDFAHENAPCWEAIFIRSNKVTKSSDLPKPYQQRILGLFQMIEDVLRECLDISKTEARRSSRLLWACLHGIAVLTLDGRLQLVGIENHHKIIDDLLGKYFSSNNPAKKLNK